MATCVKQHMDVSESPTCGVWTECRTTHTVSLSTKSQQTLKDFQNQNKKNIVSASDPCKKRHSICYSAERAFEPHKKSEFLLRRISVLSPPTQVNSTPTTDRVPEIERLHVPVRFTVYYPVVSSGESFTQVVSFKSPIRVPVVENNLLEASKLDLPVIIW